MMAGVNDTRVNHGSNPKNWRNVDDRSVLKKRAEGKSGGTAEGGRFRRKGFPELDHPDNGHAATTKAATFHVGGSGSPEGVAHTRAAALASRAGKNCGASGKPMDVCGPRVKDGTTASNDESRFATKSKLPNKAP